MTNYKQIFKTMTGCFLLITIVSLLAAFTLPESKAHKLQVIHNKAEELRKKKKPYEDAIQKATQQKKPIDDEIKKLQKEYDAVEGSSSLDLDKLSKAVAFAETGLCADGTAIKRNNCHGIMTWDKDGTRHPMTFKSKEQSFIAFKKIWQKSYKKFPDMDLAIRWTGNDNPEEWLNNVVTYYFSNTSS